MGVLDTNQHLTLRSFNCTMFASTKYIRGKKYSEHLAGGSGVFYAALRDTLLDMSLDDLSFEYIQEQLRGLFQPEFRDKLTLKIKSINRECANLWLYLERPTDICKVISATLCFNRSNELYEVMYRVWKDHCMKKGFPNPKYYKLINR